MKERPSNLGGMTDFSNLDFFSFSHTPCTLLHRHRVGIEAVLKVLVACMCDMASLSSRGRAWVRACICGCMRQKND